jgi:hypothetical protein
MVKDAFDDPPRVMAHPPSAARPPSLAPRLRAVRTSRGRTRGPGRSGRVKRRSASSSSSASGCARMASMSSEQRATITHAHRRTSTTRPHTVDRSHVGREHGGVDRFGCKNQTPVFPPVQGGRPLAPEPGALPQVIRIRVRPRGMGARSRGRLPNFRSGSATTLAVMHSLRDTLRPDPSYLRSFARRHHVRPASRGSQRSARSVTLTSWPSASSPASLTCWIMEAA